jgi:probable rRNA maturation factor
MTYHIDIQNATNAVLPLSEKNITELAALALKGNKDSAELTIRLVEAEEMIYLNKTYRKQNKTTNVLAFPCSIPEHVELEFPLLGDIIICPEVLLDESKKMEQSLEEHWSLILIHGVLHLLGYDHIKEEDAQKMQAIEIKLLAELGYRNPYDIEGNELE